MLLFDTYFKKLEELTKSSPEYFTTIKTVNEVEYLRDTQTDDPFDRNPQSSHVEISMQHVFVIQGLIEENLLTSFVDKGTNVITTDNIQPNVRKNMDIILNYEQIINFLSKYKADTKQMFWLYVVAQQLNIDCDIKNKQHCEGLVFIANMKTDMETKIELLSRHVFTPESYQKISGIAKTKWGDIYTIKKSSNSIKFNNQYSPFHPNLLQGNIVLPTPLLPLKYRNNFSSKTISMKVYETKCTECHMDDELKMVPSFDMKYKMFLCETCLSQKIMHYSVTVHNRIKIMSDDELIMIAVNPYMSTDDMRMLAFHNNKNVRLALSSNPKLPEELLSIISLQNV